MNGSNFGHIPALFIWSNMWKRLSRISVKNIKLILYRHLAFDLNPKEWVRAAGEKVHFPWTVFDSPIALAAYGLNGLREKFLHRLQCVWVHAAVCGLFAENLGSFAMIVGWSPPLFANIVGSESTLFASPRDRKR